MSSKEGAHILGIYSPYEESRETDPEETPSISFRKDLPDGDTNLTLFFTPKGNLCDAGASITKGDLTIHYSYSNNGLEIRADSKSSRFGPVQYDEYGNLSSINVTSLQDIQKYFENIGISDSEALWYLLSLMELFSGTKNVPEELKKRIDASPKLLLSDEEKESLMKEARRDTQRFRHFADNIQDFVISQALEHKYQKSIVFQDGQWVVVERDEKGKDNVVMPISWNRAFFLDEQRFALIEQGDNFVFYQESASRRRKKAIRAPLKVDYNKLNWYMGDVANWERVFKVCPSDFYEQL